MSPATYLRGLGLERVPAKAERECHECKGRGYFHLDNGPGGATEDCDNCDNCGGEGVIPAADDEEE